MSSPISKLNRFSRLFSSANVGNNNSQSCSIIRSPAKSSNSCTPELLRLPDECEREVETPSSDRAPTLCSTPVFTTKISSDKASFASGTACLKLPSSASQCQFRSDLRKIKRKCAENNLRNVVLTRNRRFGVSDGIALPKLQCKVNVVINCNV